MKLKSLEIRIIPHLFTGNYELDVRVHVNDRMVVTNKMILGHSDFSCLFDDAMEYAKREIHEIIKKEQ